VNCELLGLGSAPKLVKMGSVLGVQLVLRGPAVTYRTRPDRPMRSRPAGGIYSLHGSLGAEQEIDGLPGSVDRAIQIAPAGSECTCATDRNRDGGVGAGGTAQGEVCLHRHQNCSREPYKPNQMLSRIRQFDLSWTVRKIPAK
jgi:hypothetical protein